MAVADKLLDRGIRHAAYFERLKHGTVKEIVQILDNETIPELSAAIDKRLRKISTLGHDPNPQVLRRLKELSRTTKGVVQRGMKKIEKDLRGKLGDMAVSESQFAINAMDKALPISFSFNIPSGPLLHSIVNSRPFDGKLLKDWMSELGAKTHADVMKQLRIGLTIGESIPEITNRIHSIGGVAGQLRRNVTAVTRTAVTHVSAQAREITYEANKELVKGVQYVATLDAKTTEICASLDGKVFDLNEGPRPPMHMQCRSTTIPVLKSWEELGIPLKEAPPSTRASMNGQVAAKINYPDWLKKQPIKVQNQVLGVGKAKLFREGKYDLTKPILNGRPMTLKELNKLEGLGEK